MMLIVLILLLLIPWILIPLLLNSCMSILTSLALSEYMTVSYIPQCALHSGCRTISLKTKLMKAHL